MRYNLYVHIPFCRRKCHYCDFVSYADKMELMPRYVRALARELRGKRRLLGTDEPPRCIYMGGGTPTVLPLRLFEESVAAIMENFPGATLEEFTVEANPGTVDEEYLTLMKECGVTRLSFGVQTFNDRLLKEIGRIHTAADCFAAVKAAKKAGFAEISVDIMYGLPLQTVQDLQADIATAISLDVPHISVYGLTVEEDTLFSRLQKDGALMLPTDEETDAMYEFLSRELPKRGFGRYEISNYARVGHEGRHNLGYWRFVPYMGIGAAAHSFWRGEGEGLPGKRFFNPGDINEYFAAVFERKNFLGESEGARSLHTAMSEFCFLALRTAEGIDKKLFADLFGKEPEFFFGEAIRRLKERDALIEGENSLRLTSLGAKYGNRVFAEFV